MQALHKGAEVYIADFKGGVDFPKVWHKKCHICIREDTLLYVLNQLAAVLEYRKGLLAETGCKDLDAYNEATGEGLPRLVFACDEVAEMLDRTGRSKEDKELLAQIENRLATLARLGRAFGIHLILATQRPDANILPGQIKNNLDFRVCGRADDILSGIILGNNSADDQIPKDARAALSPGTAPCSRLTCSTRDGSKTGGGSYGKEKKVNDYGTGIPVHEVDALARILLPKIQAFLRVRKDSGNLQSGKHSRKRTK